jgi:putative DNA primase/helicase
MGANGHRLLPHHLTMLRDGSGVALDVIDERPYFSVTDGFKLATLGLQQAPTPGLVIPITTPASKPGDPQILVYRPDEPADPKRKYVWPRGQPTRLSVHPRSVRHLGDAAVPLSITEGDKKGDALLSKGRQCVVAVAGTPCFGWRLEPDLPVLADWDGVALSRRLVKLDYDSDSWRNPNVMRDRQRLTRILRDRGANVKWLRLPDFPDGSKQGVDDYLLTHTIAELDALYEDPSEDPNLSAPPDHSGDADRFVYLNADRARWCFEHQQWACWDGRRWDTANQELVTGFAKATARESQIAAARLPASDARRDALVKRAARMADVYPLKAMIELARNELAVKNDELDTDPWLFTCRNGTIDLRTSELRPHNPGDMITMLAEVEYDPETTAPEFTRYLADILNGDPELIDFVHRALGYTLTGMTNEQTYIVLTGEGGNGKGVLVRLITAVMGGYALNLPAAALHRNRNSSQGFDIAKLPGRRLATSSETTTTDYLDEQRIKALTGQEPFTAEHKYGRPFSFTPVAKLWLAVNGLPPTDDSSEGFWRRPAVIHFPNEYSPEDDPTLWDRLTAELPGILAWMVQGCLEWQQRPLRPFPAPVSRAVSQWRTDEDPLAIFLEECCEGVGDATATAFKGHLLQVYRQWCRLSGEEEIKTQGRGAQWGKMLRRHGITAGSPVHGASTWRGVQLNQHWLEWVTGEVEPTVVWTTKRGEG